MFKIDWFWEWRTFFAAFPFFWAFNTISCPNFVRKNVAKDCFVKFNIYFILQEILSKFFVINLGISFDFLFFFLIFLFFKTIILKTGVELIKANLKTFLWHLLEDFWRFLKHFNKTISQVFLLPFLSKYVLHLWEGDFIYNHHLVGWFEVFFVKYTHHTGFF